MDDLKIIKKKFGEDMMHFCRANFASLLETPGFLSKRLLSKFHENHNLLNDIKKNHKQSQFIEFIYGPKNLDTKQNKCNKTPEELMKSVGYTLVECHTEEEIQAFKKYYAKGEKLCTFRQDRLSKCRVFFAVKDNVAEIKREDYKNPKREDAYGTSVISIQFTKDKSHILSIKNRYNHSVDNPDATFGNDLDRIVEGLTESFEKTYGLKQNHQSSKFELENYVLANDGKYYKYNFERNNTYYCPDNIIIKNYKVEHFDKNKYLVIDNFIIELESKYIDTYASYIESINDYEVYIETFPRVFNHIEKITITKDKENKIVEIFNADGKYAKLIVNHFNRIKKMFLENVNELPQGFLSTKDLEIIEFRSPSTKVIGDYVLKNATFLEILSINNCQSIGSHFLYKNFGLKEIDLPNIVEIGDCFMTNNVILKRVNMPKLEIVGSEFLELNESINKLFFPSLKTVGHFSLKVCQAQEVYLPKLEKVGHSFLSDNEKCRILYAPSLAEVGDYFLMKNEALQEIILPSLELAKYGFLLKNNKISIACFPRLKIVMKSFLAENTSLRKLYAPLLEREQIKTLLERNYHNLEYCVKDSQRDSFYDGCPKEASLIRKK